jgi:hypothetical protein
MPTRSTFALVLCLIALPRAVAAAPLTLLDVTGAGNTGQIIVLDQAAAVSFTLGQTYSDVAIAADLLCIGCEGEVVLMKGLIGPSATLANLVAGTFFDTASAVDPVLHGLTLDAGDYFLIVAITGQGGAAWTGSDPFTTQSLPGVTMGLNYFADEVDDAVPFRSAFSPITSAAALHFRVSAAESVVPEPAVLSLLAVAALPILRRRFQRQQKGRS